MLRLERLESRDVPDATPIDIAPEPRPVEPVVEVAPAPRPVVQVPTSLDDLPERELLVPQPTKP